MTDGPDPGHLGEQAGPGVPPGYGAAPPQPYGGYGAYGGGPYGGYGAYGGGPYGRPSAPKPGLVPLRPLTMSDILDGAFTAIRWNPKTILIPSATVATISAVLVGLVSYIVQRQILASVNVSGSGLPMTTASAIALLVLGALTLVVTFFGGNILTGLLTVTIGQGVLGRKESPASAWRAARPRIWRLIAMMLLATVFLGGGLLLATGLAVLIGWLLGAGAHLAALGIIVGVLCGLAAWVFAVSVLIRWSLAIPVVMLERVGPLKSLGRSWRLVRRSSWRVLGILLLTELIVGIAGETIKVPFSLAGGGISFLSSSAQTHVNVIGLVLAAIGSIIASTLTAPLSAGITVLLYADLRMRREGMDITLQAAAAGAAADGRPDGHSDSPW